MLILDSLLRGALLAQWLLLAALFFRYKGRSLSALFGFLLMLGLCCQVLESMPELRRVLPLGWQAVLAGIATANSVLAWLWILSLFDDSFRWRYYQAYLWLAVFTLALLNFPLGFSWNTALNSWPQHLQRLIPLLFAGVSLWVVLKNRQTDLVAARRRLRWVLVGGSLLYVLVTAGLRLYLRSGVLPPHWALLDTVILLTVTSICLWLILQGAELFGHLLPTAQTLQSSSNSAQSATTSASPLPAWVHIDREKMPKIEAWVQKEKAYRRADFQLSDIAKALQLPEYRTRKLIHEGLGYRNFNELVNHYRVEEVKARLCDPRFESESILNLALEAGFGSLAPFNKAFKLQAGMTPTEFRQRSKTENRTNSGKTAD